MTNYRLYPTKRMLLALKGVHAEPVTAENLKIQDMYDEVADEIYSFKGVGFPFSEYRPSVVLRSVDYYEYLGLVEQFLDSLANEEEIVVRIENQVFWVRNIWEAVSLMEEEDEEGEDSSNRDFVGDMREGDRVVLKDRRILYVQTTPADERDSFFASEDPEGNHGWYFSIPDVFVILKSESQREL